MASNEPAENSLKSPTTDNTDATVSELKTVERDSPVTPPVNEDNKPNNVAIVEEKKDSITEQDIATEEKKDTDNIEDQNKHKLRSLETDENEQDEKKNQDEDKNQDRNKIEQDENEEQKPDVEKEMEKQESGSMATSLDTGDKKESNDEGNKDLTRGGTALKRKRKSQRQV
ncbi:hypothetical protein EAI_04389 [Harpegnathos saltator]|uniref:Uncharacterized protein n=1 Tax=Harpegnathos saltator TaxID=610380 RepID=E2BCP1_HARSA|nr:hypothetical protein EAI_04389 [Harpegnathos saltator]